MYIKHTYNIRLILKYYYKVVNLILPEVSVTEIQIK